MKVAGSVAGIASQAAPARRNFSDWLLLFLVHFYRLVLSPFFGGNCKYYPSCSVYAEQAIAIHGARRGLGLAMKRLLRCRPFVRGGFDPVPGRDELESGADLRGRESAR